MPDRDDNQADQCLVGIAERAGHVESERREQLREALAVVVAPDKAREHDRDDAGQEKDRAEQIAHRQVAVQQQRQYNGDDIDENRKNNRVFERISKNRPQVGVLESIYVIVQADISQLTGYAVPVRE
ncbi:hypothetical protein D9M72_612360 [compost metagenome]